MNLNPTHFWKPSCSKVFRKRFFNRFSVEKGYLFSQSSGGLASEPLDRENGSRAVRGFFRILSPWILSSPDPRASSCTIAAFQELKRKKNDPLMSGGVDFPTKKTEVLQRNFFGNDVLVLVSGFRYIFYFHDYILGGNDNKIWRAYFSDWLKSPTRVTLSRGQCHYAYRIHVLYMYLHWSHKKSTVHVGKYAIVPWIRSGQVRQVSTKPSRKDLNQRLL